MQDALTLATTEMHVERSDDNTDPTQQSDLDARSASAEEDGADPHSAQKTTSEQRITAYDKHGWIVREDTDLFCKCCRLFSVKTQANQGVWINVPFTNVKKLYMAADKHAASAGHKHALLTAE